MYRMILFAVTVVLGVSVCAAAGVNVGDRAPGWSGIPGTDDKPHSLSDYKQAKAVTQQFGCGIKYDAK